MADSFSELNGHSGRLDFSFPAELCQTIFAAAATEKLELSVFFFTLFEELLCRYTGQKTVLVHFQKDGAELAVQGPDAIVGQFSFHTFEETPAGRFCEPLTSPIHCQLECAGERIGGFFEYDRRSWNLPVVEAALDCYQTLIRQAINDRDSPLRLLDVLTPESARQLHRWNQTAREYVELTTDQLFERKAAEQPDRPALTCDGTTLSYRELSNQTHELAARLVKAGGGRDVLVGLCVERGHQMVIAMLAVLRAGGAYLPIDPAFPAERIAFMQQDARLSVILTQSGLLHKLAFTAAHVLTVDTVDALAANAADEPWMPQPAVLDDLAYVLYTSGSSGNPKGVEITHRSLTNLLSAVASDLSLTPADTVLATSTISFDISAFEIFAPLISGAHLVVAPRQVAINGSLLSAAIQDSGATVLQATPSGWRILLESGWLGKAGLKMLTAGEPLDRSLANCLLERGGGLWNLYGPTEATIYATGRKITRDDATITIGKPIANGTAYVLDEDRRCVPIGATGELYLGGLGIAKGYLNRPELTAEKFTVDESSADRGRIYRTGDLARFLPDGDIELLGRVDNQVKIRGYRIELEEIEAVLDTHASVRKSVVSVMDAGDGDRRLAAFVVAQKPGIVLQTELREHAARSLPAYMIPAVFAEIEELPHTPSGKIDRKALPALPFPVALKVDTSAVQAPDDMEQTVLASWRSILKTPDLHLDENFFDVGGHSLLAVRMFSELSAKLNRTIPPGWLIEAPTARSFANRIRSSQELPSSCLVLMQDQGFLPPIYFVHHLLGDVLVYCSMADCFAPRRQVYGIQPPLNFVKRQQPYPLVALAAEYVKELLQQQAPGPFHLAGYSSGSVVAFEMARQLSEAGYEVGLLALLDGEIKTSSTGVSKSAKYSRAVWRKLAKIIFKFKDEFADGLRQLVVRRIHHFSLLWRVRQMEKSATSPAEITLEQALLLTENAYRPGPYRGPAILLRFRDEAWRFGPNPLMGWGSLIPEHLEAIDVPGGHITGMSPGRASSLAAILEERMEQIESALKNQDDAETTQNVNARVMAATNAS